MAKDIARAYEAEQQYYKDKDTQHSNVLNILDYIGPYGYDNYDEYYDIDDKFANFSFLI